VANPVALAASQLARLVEVWPISGMHPCSASFVKPVTASLAAAALTRWLERITPGGPLHPAVGFSVLVAAYAGGLITLGFNEEDRMVAGRVRQRLRRPGPHRCRLEQDRVA
jgi:hypothetical protein